ncbi:type II toxin-antitoxin system RelE/ParE family toxin [Pusillimonas sp. SM2304]|uniref:type II toxin-antitoxin system RelE/ParE family toxin n=1 Tax=Pusillimonas sp. SM2304 TaxID=3073241 RepID=UPI0038F69C3B
MRKQVSLNAATRESDLMAPSGNRFQHLQGRLSVWCAIRVSRQYWLVFSWEDGVAHAHS